LQCKGKGIWNHAISPFCSVMQFYSILAYLAPLMLQSWKLACVSHYRICFVFSINPALHTASNLKLSHLYSWCLLQPDGLRPNPSRALDLFIHQNIDIRQILTVKHHHGFCAGESLKIDCHQDFGRGYKQISSFISQEHDKAKLHATLRNVMCF